MTTTERSPLRGKRIAFVTANEGVERVELTTPWDAVASAGGEPEIIATSEREVQTVDHLDKSETRPVDRTTAQANPADYDAVVLPGGVANPDQLRMDAAAIAFVRAFFDAHKPVAAICHGPWTLVEADLVRNRTLTSWPSLQTDIRNAGGEWVDKELVVDDGLVTSRNPDDLPAFSAAILERFADPRPAHRGES